MNSGIPSGVKAQAASQPNLSRPLFVDAFAGCGGLSLGLMRAGWKGLFAVEKDPFAFETLLTNLPREMGPSAYAWPDNIERRTWDINELLVRTAGGFVRPCWEGGLVGRWAPHAKAFRKLAAGNQMTHATGCLKPIWNL